MTGYLRAGELAQVTGVTADNRWWRIFCTGATSRQCFVPADPAQTLPAAPPNAAP